MTFTIRINRLWFAVAVLTLLASLITTLFLSSVHPTSVSAADTCQNFPETGFQVCGRFLDYWKANGGLAQQGFPISNVFEEKNADPPAGDGKIHRVQYFQRARFEEHTENTTPYDVLLGLIGSEQYAAKYSSKPTTPTPTTTQPPAANTTLVVNSKRNETKIGSATPKAGYIFFVVDLTLTNTTKDDLSSNPLYFYVVTDASYSYDCSLEASLNLPKDLKLTYLKPGEKIRGEVAFEVPTNETPKQLQYNGFDVKFTADL